ncbi:MAG: NAD(P)H-dependent oxidoreductase [Nitrospirae bacterium]|nr:NAD(P)H-dependent oxidoreductase [Nitrospirota bacterium]MBI5696057.1 NAD(P)H-dependent oxidoreductase [Nitrospirota bacterium]
MPRVLILYYTRTGNTEKMARLVEEGVKGEGIEAVVKPVADATLDDLQAADGIVIGSPTYYGLPAAEIIRLIDDSVKLHGRLEGKVGGAYSSAANIGGGNETVIMSIIQAMLVHGMVVQGIPKGDHYGPVSIGAPDERATKQCRLLGERVAKLVKKLAG